MTPEQIAELKQAAEAAESGSWWEPRSVLENLSYASTKEGAFICVASPAPLLWLIQRIETLEAAARVSADLPMEMYVP